MVAFDALHWPPTLQSIGYGESGAVTRSEQSDRIDFHMVQQSYVDARDSGRLRSGLIPSLAQFETEVRHPLCISGRQDSLKTALLNPSKVDSINRDVRSVLSSVPKPEDWCTVVKEKHLGASDVLQIIRLATGDLPRTISSSVPSTHTSIANMITCLREHAQALRSTGVLYHYARQLTDLLVCSLMQVQEHISGGDRAASVAVSCNPQHLQGSEANGGRQMLP